jgi:predicted ABC-type ATPase
VKDVLDAERVVVAIAGPNGAGKSTFHATRIADSGLHFINKDVLAKELGVGPYQAAELARRTRESFLAMGEPFVFETVFSDPAGEKLQFLQRAKAAGYTVVLCFIGLADVALSKQRVAERMVRGGHGVPEEKLEERFGRTLRNLAAAVRVLPHVFVHDNGDPASPFREVAVFRSGKRIDGGGRLPAWFPGRGPRRRGS